jgi:steroid 5-alpha reductase family enzyme
MPDFLNELARCGAIVLAYMTVWYLVALVKKDNSVADIAWGLGFVLVAAITFFRRGSLFLPLLVTGLVAVWGLRLARHIFVRNKKPGEDPRYAEWRRKWGRAFVWRSYLQVFLLQGLFLLIISSPVIIININPYNPASMADGWDTWFIGVLVWGVGLFFEAVGDAQLARFKRDPVNRGKIMDRGLWRYSRHPNYFGESLMWWGIFLIALEVPYGWTTVVSPALITFLLVRVSGVPLLEKRYAGNAEFQAYARRTSAFFPWFPKEP